VEEAARAAVSLADLQHPRQQRAGERGADDRAAERQDANHVVLRDCARWQQDVVDANRPGIEDREICLRFVPHRFRNQVCQSRRLITDDGFAAVQRDGRRRDRLVGFEALRAERRESQAPPLPHFCGGARSFFDPLVDPLQPGCDGRARAAAGNPHGDDRDRPHIGVRFDNRREVGAALDEVILVLVAAEDQVDVGHLFRDLLIAREREMRQRDDRIAFTLQLGDSRACRRHRFLVLHPRLMVGIDRQSEQTETHGAAFGVHKHDRVRDDAGKGLAILVGDVRRHEMKLRLGYARVKRRLADVELVIAERRPVEPDDIQHGDHLSSGKPLAVDHRGAKRGRRQVIAGELRQQPRVLRLQTRADGRKPRESADMARLHRSNLVDIVEMQDRDDGRTATGFGPRMNDRGDRKDAGQGGRPNAHLATIPAPAVRRFSVGTCRRSTPPSTCPCKSFRRCDFRHSIRHAVRYGGCFPIRFKLSRLPQHIWCIAEIS